MIIYEKFVKYKELLLKFICVIIIANIRNRENNGFHVERRMNMKVSNIKDIDKFFAVVDSCEGRVELVTGEGEDVYKRQDYR